MSRFKLLSYEVNVRKGQRRFLSGFCLYFLFLSVKKGVGVGL